MPSSATTRAPPLRLCSIQNRSARGCHPELRLTAPPPPPRRRSSSAPSTPSRAATTSSALLTYRNLRRRARLRSGWMDKDTRSSSSKKRHHQLEGVSPDELASALGRLGLVGDSKQSEKQTGSEICLGRLDIIRAAKDAGCQLCPVCRNYWNSMPYTRFNEVKEGLHSAISEMENARTNLKNLSANQGVSEIFDRIDAVVGLLDRAIEGSREACYEQSPASSDVREQEEIWRTSDFINGRIPWPEAICSVLLCSGVDWGACC